MANPLVNELIINTSSKDLWNAEEPEDEGAVPGILQESFGGAGARADFPRAGDADAAYGSDELISQVSGASASRRQLRQTLR